MRVFELAHVGPTQARLQSEGVRDVEFLVNDITSGRLLFAPKIAVLEIEVVQLLGDLRNGVIEKRIPIVRGRQGQYGYGILEITLSPTARMEEKK